MSDPYGYGISNPTDQPISFGGEVPIPQSISANDPGISALKANADHSHALSIGGVDTPWYNLPLGPFCGIYGGAGFRTPQYAQVGNIGLLRGLVAFIGSTAFPVQIGQLPASMAPKAQEVGLAFGETGIFRVDVWADGQVVMMMTTAGDASPSYLSLGAPYFIYVID
jgi:hypothetical protein